MSDHAANAASPSDQPDEATGDGSARPATSGATALTPSGEADIATPSPRTRRRIPTSAASGSDAGVSESGSTSPTSPTSSRRSQHSTAQSRTAGPDEGSEDNDSVSVLSPAQSVAAPVNESGTSTPSAPPAGRVWRAPRSAKEFAAQANQIATMVLNGQIDIDTARTYSAVARTAAQMLTAETSRARFLNRAPDLSLEYEDDEE